MTPEWAADGLTHPHLAPHQNTPPTGYTYPTHTPYSTHAHVSHKHKYGLGKESSAAAASAAATLGAAGTAEGATGRRNRHYANSGRPPQTVAPLAAAAGSGAAQGATWRPPLELTARHFTAPVYIGT